MDTPGHAPAIDIVAIVASAGGVTAISRILANLPPGLPAAVIVLMHVGSNGSLLPEIFSRLSAMPVSFAAHGAELERGTIVVAPPDRHLTVDRALRLSLTRGPKIFFSRPAADPLLVSLALHAGARTLGVILTGANDDGSTGAWALRHAGGIVVAQDVASSEYPEMPRTAAAFNAADFVLPLPKIALAIETLTSRPEVADVFRRDLAGPSAAGVSAGP
jgi:two-component system chemotaxis response regulator CheB